jgi:hypothetical protein
VAYNSYAVEEVHIDFEYQICSLIDVICDIIHDPVLSSNIQWYPMRCFLIVDGQKQQFIDDVDCTLDWWKIQVQL